MQAWDAFNGTYTGPFEAASPQEAGHKLNIFANE